MKKLIGYLCLIITFPIWGPFLIAFWFFVLYQKLKPSPSVCSSRKDAKEVIIYRPTIAEREEQIEVLGEEKDDMGVL